MASSPLLRCACGSVFVPDALYCRRCGARRPSAAASAAAASAAVSAVASGAASGAEDGGAGNAQPFGLWPQATGGRSPPSAGGLGSGSSAASTPWTPSAVAPPSASSAPCPAVSSGHWPECAILSEPIARPPEDPVVRYVPEPIAAPPAPRPPPAGPAGGGFDANQEVFDEIDRNHDGVISRTEFEAAVGGGGLLGGQLDHIGRAGRWSGQLGPPSGQPRTGSRSPAGCGGAGAGAVGWQERASVRLEALGLASTLKADRDIKARGAASARLEIGRLAAYSARAGGARRPASAGSLGAYASTASSMDALDAEMNSRIGAATVHKLVGTTKSLLQGLEEALLLRAGFLAGTFHSWRCEAGLQRAGRRFQDEFARHQAEWARRLAEESASFQDLMRQDEARRQRAEIARGQVIRVAERFFAGGAEVMMREVWHTWQGLVEESLKERLRSRAKRGTTLVMRRFTDHLSRGQLASAWSVWRQLVAAQRGAALRSQRAQQVLGSMLSGAQGALLQGCFFSWRQLQLAGVAANEQQRRLEALQAEYEEFKRQQRDSAQKSVGQVIRKWAAGERWALLLGCFQEWCKLGLQGRNARRHKEAVCVSLVRAVEGDRRGLLRASLLAWLSRARLDAEQRKQDGKILEIEAALQKQQAWAAQELKRRQRDTAQKSVEQMIRKWVAGERRALLLGSLQEWCKMGLQCKAARRHKDAVCMSLVKAAQGDRRGLLHSSLLAWLGLARWSAEQRAHEGKILELEVMLQGQRRAALSAEEAANRRHAKAEAVLQHTMRCWFAGDSKGLVGTTFREWKALHKQTQKKEANHQSVSFALHLFLEGSQKAAVHSCLMNWKCLAQSQRHAKTVADAVDSQRRHWEEARAAMLQRHSQEIDGILAERLRQKDQAHAAVEVVLRQWATGGSAGLIVATFAHWHVLSHTRAQARRSVYQLERNFWRGMLRLTLVCWRVLAESRGSIAKLQQQVDHLLRARSALLGRCACMLGGGAGVAFAAWKDAVAQMGRDKLCQRLDAARTRREELMAVSLRGLGLRSRRAVLLEAFKAWLLAWERAIQELAGRMARSESLARLSEVLARQPPMDRRTLLLCCLGEWHREALGALKATCRAMRQKAAESGEHAGQLEQRVALLQEQLWSAFQEIDKIAGHMQKELQTKEEMAAELREAYARVRGASLSPEVGRRHIANSVAARARSAPNGRTSCFVQHLLPTGALPLPRLYRGGASSQVPCTPFACPPGRGQACSWRAQAPVSRTSPGAAAAAAALAEPAAPTNAQPSSSSCSPGHPCDWDAAVSRMHAEGLVRADGAPD